MRTHQELMAEIKLRSALGLPRIELTPEERIRAFGDPSLEDKSYDNRAYLLERLKQGLPMSIADKREARRYQRESK